MPTYPRRAAIRTQSVDGLSVEPTVRALTFSVPPLLSSRVVAARRSLTVTGTVRPRAIRRVDDNAVRPPTVALSATLQAAGALAGQASTIRAVRRFFATRTLMIRAR